MPPGRRANPLVEFAAANSGGRIGVGVASIAQQGRAGTPEGSAEAGVEPAVLVFDLRVAAAQGGVRDERQPGGPFLPFPAEDLDVRRVEPDGQHRGGVVSGEGAGQGGACGPRAFGQFVAEDGLGQFQRRAGQDFFGVLQGLHVAVREVGPGHGEGAHGTVQVLLPGGQGGGLFGGHPVPPAALFLRGGAHTGGIACGVAFGVAGLLGGRAVRPQRGKDDPRRGRGSAAVSRHSLPRPRAGW